MSQVTAKQVHDLRKMSGAGMMDCKNALAESDGNLEDAFKWLREKGIAKAEKKSTRDANEGLVGIKTSDSGAAIVEINSETDFVSRNSEFQSLVNNVLDIAILENFLEYQLQNVARRGNAGTLIQKKNEALGNIMIYHEISTGLAFRDVELRGSSVPLDERFRAQSVDSTLRVHCHGELRFALTKPCRCCWLRKEFERSSMVLSCAMAISEPREVSRSPSRH